MITREKLLATAVEMQDVMGFKDDNNNLIIIDDTYTIDELKQFITDAVPEIDPEEDVFSVPTSEIIDLFANGEDVEIGSNGEEPAGPVDLKKEIDDSTKLKELKAIVLANNEFKSIRSKLSGYKKMDDLRDDMLWILDSGAQAEAKAQAMYEKNIANKPIKTNGEESEETETDSNSTKIRMVRLNEVKREPPFSNLFSINPKILDIITEDMINNGYDMSFPINLWNGIIVDGNTRHAAAEAAGLEEIPVVDKTFVDEKTALEYAIHNQRDRRNITDAELISIIEIVDVKFKGGPSSNKKEKRSAEITAEITGTNRGKVEKARVVLKDKEALKAVKSGKKNINAASNEILNRNKPNKKVKEPSELTRVGAIMKAINGVADRDRDQVKLLTVSENANDLFVSKGGVNDIDEQDLVSSIVLEVLQLFGYIKFKDTENSIFEIVKTIKLQ